MTASLLVLLYFQRKSLAVSRTKSVSRRTVFWILNLIGAAICAAAFGMEFGSAVVGGVYLISLVVAEFCTVMMEKRTKQSAETLGKVLGLRQFIESAELDRINQLVEQDPAYFFNVLPYAYVMGLTDKWAKNFEKITIVQPDWYVGYEDSTLFNAWMFNSMMRDCYRAAESHIEIAIPDGGDSGGRRRIFEQRRRILRRRFRRWRRWFLVVFGSKRRKSDFFSTLYGLSSHSYCISLCDIV